MNLRRGGFLGVVGWIAAAQALTAQAPPRCEVLARAVTPATHQWKAPLGRTISLKASDVSLRDALNTLASNAGVRLSYNPDLIPLDRTVCVALEDIPLGAALIELLRGIPVEPVVAGADQVVLSPARSRPAEPASTPRSEPVVPLEPVVINVDAVTAAQRTHAIDIDVLDGRQLGLQDSRTLAEVFNSAVAGVWAWPQSSSLAASYGSIRGASSFGVTYPKIYIDGIEVANPLLVRRISPESIERIEVIRGPGGAALYGADAISGVTNIITRHQSPVAGAPRVHIRSGFGLAASSFTPGDALSQDHMISVQTGTAARSAGLNVAFGSAGEIIPGADARYVSADGSARYVRSNSMITGTLRFFAERTGAAGSPLLEEPQATFASANDADAQSVVQYTAGIRAFFAPGGRWTHSLVLGADGYALSGISDSPDPYTSAADSALRAAGAGALRGTLRLSSSARFQPNPAMTAALTLSADQSVLGQHAFAREAEPIDNGPVSAGRMHIGSRELRHDDDVRALVAGPDASTDTWRSNTGVGAQFNAGLFERLFVTSGLRFEDSGSETSGIATLPMFGAALLAANGPLTVKLRAAYGKGIRWPETATDLRKWYEPHAMTSRFDLAPEQQHGIEAGVDVAVGKLLEMQVTRFDQTASGLFQRIAIAGSPQPSFGGRHVLYELQNVGEISNRGWEMQAALRTGPLSIAGALSLVDSRVQNLASGYTGDLRAGDRMLAVPDRTISLTAAWLGSGWSTAWTIYRAANWVNYDRVGLASALANSTDPARELSGDQLRTYWRDYNGITHMRFTATREIRRGLALTFSGDNLLNRQLGEPDNITVAPGRTLSLGVRASF